MLFTASQRLAQRSFVGSVLWVLLCPAPLQAADPLKNTRKPADDAPLQSELQSDRLVIRSGEQLLATFVFRDEEISRPYFANIHTAHGIPVTRHHPPHAGEDDLDHDTMHPGLWPGFGDLAQQDFWRNKATIRHRRFIVNPTVTDRRLNFATESELLSESGEPLGMLISHLLITINSSETLIVWDVQIRSDRQQLAFGDQEEMGFGVRVATPLTERRGGRIVNSEGLATAANTWGQPADWCDYSGTGAAAPAGVTLMAAPNNFRRSWWHNRDYGLMVANPFGRAAMQQGAVDSTVIPRGKTLRLCFGAALHDGEEYQPQAAYDRFAAIVAEMQSR